MATASRLNMQHETFKTSCRLQVRKLMATAAPVPLKLAGSQQAGDVELVSAQQQRLMAVAVRTMALPLGRGALALGTHPRLFFSPFSPLSPSLQLGRLRARE